MLPEATLTTRQLVDELLIRLGFDPGFVVSGTIDFDADRTLTAMVVKREVVNG